MALEGPQLRYARIDDSEAGDAIAEALELARRIEALLEATPSVRIPIGGSEPHVARPDARSTRMVRAVASSLVDELEALVRGTRKSGVA